MPPCGPAPELTIVVPTFNEKANIPLLVERLAQLLDGLRLGGYFRRRQFAGRHGRGRSAPSARADSRVRCIRRIGRRGLAGACLEGMLASQARYVAVMDADLQHDEGLLVPMLEALRAGRADVAVASRYLYGGSAAGLSKQRSRVSRGSNTLVRLLLGIDLTDPMSGHFMIRRDALEAIAPSLSTQGFKILLDILATARGSLRTIELPSTFRERQHGESKLDSKIALDFAALVTAKLTNDAVSARFLLFCLVGLTGIGIHLSILSALLITNLSFGAAQAFATIGAIAWNFVLNNLFTYRDQRLTGWRFRHRPDPLSGDLRHRRHLQCRHRHLDLRLRRNVVDRGSRRRADRHRLELRGQRRAGLAAKVGRRHHGTKRHLPSPALRAASPRRGEVYVRSRILASPLGERPAAPAAGEGKSRESCARRIGNAHACRIRPPMLSARHDRGPHRQHP